MANPIYDNESDVLSESETRLQKPPMYKVLLHNDDFTTMDFVMFILESVFHKSEIESFAIMMKVHQEGIGIAGIYTYDIANTKADKTMNLARAHEYPLLCTIEEE